MKTIIISDRVINNSIFPHATFYNLENIKIYPCIGCLDCIIKTPGKCIYDNTDIANEINKNLLESNLVFVITKIKYGCYDIPFKRLLDRGLPNFLPFSRIYKGEVFNIPRLIVPKRCIFIGYGNPSFEEKKIFKDIARKNSLDMYGEQYDVHICKKDDINNILEKLGGINNA